MHKCIPHFIRNRPGGTSASRANSRTADAVSGRSISPLKNFYALFSKNKTAHIGRFFGGWGEIRTPGGSPLNGFQDRRIKPLCHPSTLNLLTEFQEVRVLKPVVFWTAVQKRFCPRANALVHLRFSPIGNTAALNRLSHLSKACENPFNIKKEKNQVEK